MKFNFRKISAIASSILLAGMTVGVAAAANYPTPFVGTSTADVAIVYGASSLDSVAAQSIYNDLAAGFAGGASTISGGESFALDKDTDHFNFNDALNGISGYADLGSDEMTFLADGSYDDGSIDEDYEQSIDLSSQALTLFATTKYQSEEPTIGFWFENKDDVLSYTITFDNDILLADMIDTNMPLLGNEYYVLDAEEDKITLLDSADSIVLTDGETVTVNGKQVSIEFIDGDDVKLKVDSETTDVLNVGDTYKLDDGSYVAIKEVLSSTRETTTQKVEFSIGSGKIILETGKDIIFGEDTDDEIDELTATVESDATTLTSITINWASKDDTFLTEGNAINMPGFGKIGLDFGGLNYPTSSETITVDNGDTLTLVMGNYEIPLMWMNSTGYQDLGEKDYPLILVNDSYTFAEAGFANASTPFWLSSPIINTSTLLTDGLAVEEDDRFVVTRLDTDLSDVETLYYEVNDLEVDGTTVTLELSDLVGSTDLTFDDVNDTDENGDVVVTLVGFDSDNTTAYLDFAAGSDAITYNKVVSELGMVITIPTTAGEDQNITFTEANDEGDVNTGTTVRALVKNSSDDKLFVELTHDNIVQEETTSDNNYLSIVDSSLASKIMTNEPTGSDSEYDFELEYFGEEITADVNVVAGGEVSTTGGLGAIVFKDTETSSFANKNLIVVGGSCINTVAASLVGGAYCGAQFTTATGVGTGQYMVKSFPYNGKIALLVAGYEAADTTAAAAYVTTQSFDSSAVNYKGTTATVI